MHPFSIRGTDYRAWRTLPQPADLTVGQWFYKHFALQHLRDHEALAAAQRIRDAKDERAPALILMNVDWSK